MKLHQLLTRDFGYRQIFITTKWYLSILKEVTLYEDLLRKRREYGRT